MTVLKDIPEKWFPVVLPLQRKKQKGLNGDKKKRAGTSLCEHYVPVFTVIIIIIIIVVVVAMRWLSV